jgi:hypothetical protein
MTTPIAAVDDSPEPVVELNLNRPSKTLDQIFDGVHDEGEDIGVRSGDDMDSQPVEPAPAIPIEPVTPVTPVQPVATDLDGVPVSLLKLETPAVAPVAPVVPPPVDNTAADAAYDRQTELTAARFSNAEQKKAFYEVRKEAKEHKLQAREAQQKIAEYEQKLRAAEEGAKKLAESQVQAAAQPTVELQGKISELEKQLATYEDKIGKLDLQQSDGFQKQFELPLKAAEARLAKLLTGGHRDAEAAATLAKEIVSQTDRDVQLNLLSEDPIPIQGAVINVLADMADIRENRQIAVDNWKASKAYVAEEQKRAATSAFIHDVYANTDAAIQTLTQEGNFLLQQVPDNADWNASVEKRINAARGILQSGDVKTLIKYAVDGVTAADTRMLYSKLAQEFMKLKREASALISVSPVVNGSPVVPSVTPADSRPTSSAELMRQTFGDD